VGCRLRRARACCVGGSAHGSGRQTKDGNAINNPYLGIVNRQAFIMIRTAGELGFTPSARASLGMIEKSGRRGPRLIEEVNPFDEFRLRRWWQQKRR
jgi:phage terminase small subunit